MISFKNFKKIIIKKIKNSLKFDNLNSKKDFSKIEKIFRDF